MTHRELKKTALRKPEVQAEYPRFKGSWLPEGIFGWTQRTD
jgi:hypothetical protein